MEVLFTFTSTLAAVNGEAALRAGGLAVKVMGRPTVLGAGCGLCLRLPAAEAAAARELLAAAGLAPEGLYDRLEEDGTIVYRPRPAASGPPT